MILRSFASNQPYTLIAVPVTVLSALLPAMWFNGLPVIQSGFPADELFSWIYLSHQAVIWTTIVLILGGAILANLVFNRHEFFNVPVYVPALVYAMLGSTISLIQLSLPVLLANIFILAGLNRHLRIFRQTRVLAESFESGFWYGMAAVFFPPYMILIVGLWVTTLISRAFHWREHVLPLISFATPFLYWIAWKYWNHDLDHLVLFRKVLTYDAKVFFYEFNWVNGLFITTAGITLILALPRYLFLSDRSSNKARSVKNVFLIVAIALCLSLLLGYLLIMKWVLLTFLLPLCFVVGYWFTNYRFSLIAPFVFYFLCLCSTLVVLNFYHLLPAS